MAHLFEKVGLNVYKIFWNFWKTSNNTDSKKTYDWLISAVYLQKLVTSNNQLVFRQEEI